MSDKYIDLDETITVLVPYLQCQRCPASVRIDLNEKVLAEKLVKKSGWSISPPICPTCLKVN